MFGTDGIVWFSRFLFPPSYQLLPTFENKSPGQKRKKGMRRSYDEGFSRWTADVRLAG